MSYAIYTFSGVIIRHVNVGENSRLFWLATRDSGVVMVRAQGIREEKSKMRATAQLFSFVVFEVIKGKEGWKLVGCSDLVGGKRTVCTDTFFPYFSSLSEMAYNLVFESDSSDVPDFIDFYSRFAQLLEEGSFEPKRVLLVAYAELLSRLGFLEQEYYLDSDFFNKEICSDESYWKELFTNIQSSYQEAGR